mgnify:CR=1 FL=1
MKGQWYLLAGIVFAIIIAIFAVLNVSPVEVNFLFGTAHWPLVLVILFSTLMGGVIAGSLAIYQIVVLKKQLKKVQAVNGENKLSENNLEPHE